MKIDLEESQTILQEATALEIRWMNLEGDKAAYNSWLADALELQSRLQPLMDRYEDRYISYYQEKLEIERRREATIKRFNEIQRNRGFRRQISDDPFADLSPSGGGGGGFAPPPPLPTVKDTPNEPERNEAQDRRADWIPNAPFLQQLAATSTLPEMEDQYHQLKKIHLTDPLFYVDAGDFYLRRGHRSEGLRILSNIAELNINDVQLLRMLGYRLRALNQRTEALQIFQQIYELRQDDPHSLRDLALAHLEIGHVQKAADLLWEVIHRPWPDYHGNISEVALNEWNALLADETLQIDTSQFNLKLKRNFPVDLRIVMSWDTDLADIDLVVFDPANSYPEPEDPITRTGDLLTGDIMGGYGPEEFLVRRALPGRYSVRANYNSRSENRLNSPTTVYVDITTNFGRPNAETRRIYRRIQPSQSGVEITRFVHEIEINAN